eukprot:144696_1
MEHIFKPLPKLPLQFDEYMPKPLFYPKHSNIMIISTEIDDINPGIFKYNLDNNNLEKLQKYVDFEPVDNGQFIDYNNDTLHILSWDDSHVEMDLQTNIINNKDKSSIIWTCDLHDEYPQCVEISSIKGDEIHIVIDYENRFKFDCSHKLFTKIVSKKK